MADSHLANSIRYLVRLGEAGSYSHCLLCAEQTFRAADKKKAAEAVKGQTHLDLGETVKADCTPPLPPLTMRVRAVGRVGSNFTGLRSMLDRIAAKHDIPLIGDDGDPRDYGYDGDIG